MLQNKQYMQRYSLTASKVQKSKYYQQQPTFRPRNQNNNSSKVISFVGNIEQNIDKIIADVGCCKNCQFRSILLIFANKLQKLRNDRQSIKEKYISDIHSLQTKIKMLQQQNSNLKFKIETFCKQSYVQREQTRINDFLLQPSFLNSNQNQQSEIGDKQLIQEDDYNTINKIAIKYNICGGQLQGILKEYLQSDITNKSDDPQKKRLKNLHEKLIKEREIKQIRNKISSFSKSYKNKQNFY